MERSLSDVPPLIRQAAKPLIRSPKIARINIPPAWGSPGAMIRSTDSLMTKKEPTRRIVEISRDPRREKRLYP